MSFIPTMTAPHHRSFLVALLLIVSVGAFAPNVFQSLFQGAFQPQPELEKHSHALEGQTLEIRLTVSESSSLSSQEKNNHLGISNLVIQLHPNLEKDSNLPMPGFNGPHPGTSAGVGTVEIQKPGHFIDLTGAVSIPWDSDTASWELVWRKDAPAGVLICGMHLHNDVTRNDGAAKLHKGRVYMSFPVWTNEKLHEFRDRKHQVQEANIQYMKDREDELVKIQQTNNLLMKALHYRKAAEAVELASLLPNMSEVPEESDVYAVGDFWLTRAGTVWKKGGAGNMGQKILLGTAMLRLSDTKTP